MNLLKQILEILRDLGIVIGVPTLIVLVLRMVKARIELLKDQIESLKIIQYPQAFELIQAQKALFEIEKKQLQQQFEKNALTSHDKEEIKENIQVIEQGLTYLKNLNQEMNKGIESEAIRKFEMFLMGLNNPNSATPEDIFNSITYGDGISEGQAIALEKKGLIEIKDGHVCLTENGKRIWRSLAYNRKNKK